MTTNTVPRPISTRCTHKATGVHWLTAHDDHPRGGYILVLYARKDGPTVIRQRYATAAEREAQIVRYVTNKARWMGRNRKPRGPVTGLLFATPASSQRRAPRLKKKWRQIDPSVRPHFKTATRRRR